MNQIFADVIPVVVVLDQNGTGNGQPIVYSQTEGQWRDPVGRPVTELMASKLSECWEQQLMCIERDQQLAALRELFLSAVALPAAAVETLTCVARSFLHDPELEEVT
jgi:hypothetical protein